MSGMARSVALLLLLAFALFSGCGSSSTPEPTTRAVNESDGPPILLSLSVSPLAMTPEFNADVHDYVVPCVAGDNPMALTATASSGAMVNVITPTTTVVNTGQEIDMTLAEDDPVILETSLGDVHESYWLRCLPHDFPVVDFADHVNAGTRTPGYYLMGDVFPAATAGESGFAMILDTHGTPIWYQRVSTTAGAFNIDWQPNGTLSYVKTLGDYGTDPTATYVMQRFDPWTTTTVTAVNGPIDEHELHLLPDGDVMVFSYILASGVDLTGLGSFGASETVADCTAEELDPAGHLVWSWAASDHIDPVKESKGYLVNVVDGVKVADVYHFNSIDVDGSNNVLVSSRATSAVYYIDRASGKALWKMGGNPYSKDGAQILNFANDPEGGIDSQHDARFQANGDVSVFDDHTNLGGMARGIEYAIDTNAGTASMVWEYPNVTWSEAMGSFRRYGDGSNLISWGLSPKTVVDITEVDDAGHDLLDITFANNQDSSYRAVKVPTTTFDASVLRATAGHP